MKLLLPVFIAVLLLMGALPGKLLPTGDHAHAVAQAGALAGAEHPHAVMPGGHCTVSISCGPVVVVALDVSFADDLRAPDRPWAVGSGVLRGHLPERDPPVPRV